MNTYDLVLTIEKEVEKYYMEQAEKNKDESLKKVFNVLAHEEEEHLKLLTSKKDHITAPIDDNDIINQAKNLFKDLGDIETFREDEPSQVDTYRKMLELEEKTRDFYRQLIEKDPARKEVYQFLSDEEDKHCIIIEELIRLTSRPEEWIESAEFTSSREDY